MQLLETFLEYGFMVTFASTAGKTEYSKNLGEIGIKEKSIELNHPSFDEFIKQLQPDVVIFDRFMVKKNGGGGLFHLCNQGEKNNVNGFKIYLFEKKSKLWNISLEMRMCPLNITCA